MFLICKNLRIECSLFVKTCIPFNEGSFVPCLVEIGPVVPEKKMKSLQTDGWTHGEQAIRKAHLSFQLRWAKKYILIDHHMGQWLNLARCLLCRLWCHWASLLVSLLSQYWSLQDPLWWNQEMEQQPTICLQMSKRKTYKKRLMSLNAQETIPSNNQDWTIL